MTTQLNARCNSIPIKSKQGYIQWDCSVAVCELTEDIDDISGHLRNITEYIPSYQNSKGQNTSQRSLYKKMPQIQSSALLIAMKPSGQSRASPKLK